MQERCQQYGGYAGLREHEQCQARAVFWHKCEAHLTDRERAVWELVQAVYNTIDGTTTLAIGKYAISGKDLGKLHRTVVAVKEQP